jgi:hypothetical protein
MMAAASAQRRDAATALEHLRRAIALNGENRSRARQDADFESLRDESDFRAALEPPPVETPAAPNGSAARVRKPRR